MIGNRYFRLPLHYQQAAMTVAATSLAGIIGPTSAMAENRRHRHRRDRSNQLRKDADTLLKGNRSVLAKILSITSDQIKVDVGEVQPRFPSLEAGKPKDLLPRRGR